MTVHRIEGEAMNVKLYALSTCPYCRMTKQYLDDSGVDYDLVEVDMLEDPQKKQTVEEVRSVSGGTSFPVLVVDGQAVVGFDKPKIKGLLAL